MPLKRDIDQLRNIAEQLQQRVNGRYPGLGMILFVFDAVSDTAERPVAICLHGVSEVNAARLMHVQADAIMRGRKPEESRIILPPGVNLV